VLPAEYHAIGGAISDGFQYGGYGSEPFDWQTIFEQLPPETRAWVNDQGPGETAAAVLDELTRNGQEARPSPPGPPSTTSPMSGVEVLGLGALGVLAGRALSAFFRGF
jgi:hypothetical protein